MLRKLPLKTEVRLILSILNAYKERPPTPWGITAAGWHRYRSHWSKEVRDAAEAHPHCGIPVFQRVGGVVEPILLQKEKACA